MILKSEILNYNQYYLVYFLTIVTMSQCKYQQKATGTLVALGDSLLFLSFSYDSIK
jgi:hypothetical protein